MRYFLLLFLLSGCFKDRNSAPIYNKDTGFAENCRAVIKEEIDGYRNHEYSAEMAIEAIDRNCGENGISWKIPDPTSD